MTDTYEKNDIAGGADSAAVIDIGSNSIRYAAGRNGKKLVVYFSRKGYVEKIQSAKDRREYHLRPTQKYFEYYNISYSYLHTVVERVRERFPAEDVDKMEQMLTIISEELMPELDLKSKTEDE